MLGSLSNVYLFIPAGGKGTRLFPLSTEECPKQFCPLDNEQTFIQATVKRFLHLGLKPVKVVVATTTATQTRLAVEQLSPLGVLTNNIVQIDNKYGYVGAMFKGAEHIRQLDPKAIIINTPADHFVKEGEAFAQAIEGAVLSAQQHKPAIIGVKVTDPIIASGLGHAVYLEDDKQTAYEIVSFVEKPDPQTAIAMLQKDNSAGNTGINVWSLASISQTAKKLPFEEREVGTDELMKALVNLRVVPGRFVWQDCGTLQALWEVSDKTPNHHNAYLGEGRVLRSGCLHSLFVVPKGFTLRALNLRHCATVINVIDHKIVVALVALEESQSVKQLAERFQTEVLLRPYSIDATNNTPIPTELEINIGFVGVHGYGVSAFQEENGEVQVIISKMSA